MTDHAGTAATTLGISTAGLDLEASVALAAEADAAGVHAIWTSELYSMSATVSLAAMATGTRRCRLGSSILYGVGRTPLVLAAEARSLDKLSGGRLVLGLGNGTVRMLRDWHGTDPSAPAARMEELVTVVRKLWRIHEGRVHHDGHFYHVDITPTGDVRPPLRECIPVYLAGVNPRMIEVAGRVADGLVGHPLFTLRYLDEVVRPAITKGAGRMGRRAENIRITTMVIAAVDEDEEQARRDAASQIAFYASVKTYDRALAVAGFAAEARAIREAFARGDLEAMTAAVPDRMIDAIAVAGTPRQVRDALRRYEGTVDHVILYAPTLGLAAPRADRNVRRLVAIATAPRDGAR
ncbi:LLM class flavin-dependent oxidoreductase [Amycolatopsis acidiphila]|uniref:LLM class flavin-dependent oxidoreductase n=1 Tax=Amycolatopsis acidiphila TaxID=715473 RepID=A0A558AI01_9PSEU|nr:LLM class flavin-dependent oxidoreductase [Amycolatopsis acidiphila]TVT23902.1 LLM class flavin-dependent oxidoreductase [Amycolatopsis acidiphila]UIJ61122.1 LLM class flavin-dependent oxidoreductase [Amycolatopsis acidiphila]GHG86598.1 luciferase-like protein [Amycolatopsis acidiphila]